MEPIQLSPRREVVGMLKNEIITLETADHQNVDLLVKWTLDPVAQGPYKRVPRMTAAELHDLFLQSADRQYFLIRRTANREPLGRFYYRAWRFGGGDEMVDWELNILIAEPNERGKGYGTAVQELALHYLLQQPETRSVFAYTYATNRAERRSLEKAGLEEKGYLPHPYYSVRLPPEESVLYVREKDH
jgi:RimJ/RimL family protein N-acetyltransferase